MKIYKLILLAVWALSFVACEKDPDPQITVPESISLGVDATITTFEVSSNVAWKMTVSDPWFKITPKHGSGKTTLKIGVERNTTGAERISTLEFVYADGATVRVPVSQAAYTAEMHIEAPTSAVVEKGKQLTLKISSNTDDWTYTLTDGDWLKEASKDEKSLTFDLAPSVKFDVTKPASIIFTSPSDPVFTKSVEILPVDFVKFSATAPESGEVKKGMKLTVDISSNVEDWTYMVMDGAWMSEASKTSTQLVFDLDPGKITASDVNAKITFSSPTYATLALILEIQPISDEPLVILADKSKMRAFVLENDGVVPANNNVGSEYLFDGKWMVNKSDYHTCNIEGADMAYKHWELNTSVDQFNAGHKDSFTIDAGEPMRLAKFVSYHYYNYSEMDPMVYEIYAYVGSANEPEADWTNWKLLGKVDVSHLYQVLKPIAAKEYSEYIANGDTLEIPEDQTVEARYYRFRMLSNGYAIGKTELNQWWTGRIHWLTLSEVSLYKYE